MPHDGISCQFNPKLDMEVEHIPGKCTSLFQSSDVGINRSLRAKTHNDAEDWMLGSDKHF